MQCVSTKIKKGMEKILSSNSLLKKEDLEVDLKKLGKEILKEFFLFSRSLTLFTRKHPGKDEVTRKHFRLLKKFFRLRSYFDFHLYLGKLYAMGILQEEEIFIRSLKSELSRFSIGSVFIYSQVSTEELAIFLRRLSEKTLSSLRNSNLPRFLEEKKITSIRMKKSEPDDPFVDETKALIERGDDLKVRTLAKLSLQEEPKVMLDILMKRIEKDIDLEGRVKFDFRLRVFQSVILEEFSRLPVDKVIQLLVKEFRGKNRETILADKKYLEGMRSLAKALGYHPQGDYLFNQLKEILGCLEIPEDIFKASLEDNCPEGGVHKLVCG